MSQRRINLLPPEFAARRRSRQILRTIIVAGVAVLVLLAGIFVYESQRASSEKQKLADEQQTIANLQSQVADLTEVQQLQGELRRKTALLSDLTNTEVRWSVVLADISLVIPQDAWLTNFTGSVSAAASATATAETNLGQLELDGVTFTHLDVAKWLIRLGEVDALQFPYLSLSSKGTIGPTQIVNFTSTVQLSTNAFRRNQQGARRTV